jgi:hypothetical protein
MKPLGRVRTYAIVKIGTYIRIVRVRVYAVFSFIC